MTRGTLYAVKVKCKCYGHKALPGSSLYRRGLVAAGLLMALLSLLPAVQAGPDAILEVGKFSAEAKVGSLPTGWKPLYFRGIKGHTHYALVKDDGAVVVKAVSHAAASALFREIKINPREYPIVQWRWKITNILEKGNAYRKSGDDYPARLDIAFAYNATRVGYFERLKYRMFKWLYGEYPPFDAMTYIWANRVPKGTVIPNAYTDRDMMFVVESGTKKLNQWVTEERNLYRDYKHAFGGEPPMISGVAIMTDTDSTGESAVTYYGDILFKANRTNKTNKTSQTN
jgi:hypothetical protein